MSGDDEEMFTVTRAEWKDVIRIAREDGMHIHKSYKAFIDSQAEQEDPKTDTEETEGKPPPKQDKPAPEKAAKKKSLWWGDRYE
jgi:hypothetical protein